MQSWRDVATEVTLLTTLQGRSGTGAATRAQCHHNKFLCFQRVRGRNLAGLGLQRWNQALGSFCTGRISLPQSILGLQAAA